jgi:CNT family concentrative nucleoside transporter
LLQDKILYLHHTKPTDTIRRYRITEHTDSTLVLKEGETTYILKKELYNNLNSKTKSTTNKSIIPSKGFTINSLWRGVLGMISLLLIAFLLSNDKKNINWKTVGLGVFFQLLIAICVLKVTFVKFIFEFIGKIFIQVLNFTQAGSEFVFGEIINVESYGFIFAFQVLPTILFFSALTSLLFYLGIIQKTVKAMGFILSKVLGISGPESLSVAGNVFLGQTEAPLLIKAYLEKMNGSEILLVMVGGMATVAGAVLAAYIGFLGGNDETLKLFYAQHLLAASVMAAPGAIVISKILYPQTQKVNNTLSVSSEKIGTNVLDAIAIGTTEGLKLAVNVGAMLLVFVSFIAMINFGFEKIGAIGGMNYWININTPYENLSLEMILGYAFSPLMWLIGIAKEDMALMGQLLGIKLAASEFVGYIQLAELKNTSNTTHLSYNKSVIMATYMLCGFANFASIGIQIAGIGSLAPNQRKKLSKLGIKALIGGSIVSLISATIAGMMIG